MAEMGIETGKLICWNDNYDQAKDTLKNYFEPKENKEYER